MHVPHIYVNHCYHCAIGPATFTDVIVVAPVIPNVPPIIALLLAATVANVVAPAMRNIPPMVVAPVTPSVPPIIALLLADNDVNVVAPITLNVDREVAPKTISPPPTVALPGVIIVVGITS